MAIKLVSGLTFSSQLGALVDRLRRVGVQYIVLAIDEMNMLHHNNYDNFRKTIMSLGTVMLNHFKDLFVVFAGKCIGFVKNAIANNIKGTIHSPLKQVITESLGSPVSISPSLFSLTDIEHILDGKSATIVSYLTNV